MAPKMTLTAVYEPVDDGWIQARLKEVPGVITVGRTREEAKELLLDALHEYLLALGEEEAAAVTTDQSEPFEISLSR